MRKNVCLIIIATLTLGLANLACRLFPRSDDAPPQETAQVATSTPDTVTAEQPAATEPVTPTIAPTPTSSEVDQPADDETATEAAGPEFLDLDSLDVLAQPEEIKFFRQSLLYTFDGQASDGSPVTGTVQGRGAFSSQPPATNLEFFAVGNALVKSGTVFTYTQIEDSAYFYTENTGCITLFQGEIENPFETILKASSMLSGNARRVTPDETVNGVETYQFDIDTTNLEISDTVSSYIKEIREGRVYVAKNGGYVVRLWIQGIGESKLMVDDQPIEGDVYYELNFYDFDVPLEITPPRHCGDVDEIGAGQPLMDDAIKVSASPGVTNYITSYSLTEVVNFYKTELPARGWTLIREFVNAPSAILTYQNETHYLQITISENEDTVAVSIIEMEK